MHRIINNANNLIIKETSRVDSILHICDSKSAAAHLKAIVVPASLMININHAGDDFLTHMACLLVSIAIHGFVPDSFFVEYQLTDP